MPDNQLMVELRTVLTRLLELRAWSHEWTIEELRDRIHFYVSLTDQIGKPLTAVSKNELDALIDRLELEKMFPDAMP